jgi:flagellar basal-body rod protein FlgF
MTDGIYIGMAGATARLAQLDAVADNLANAETPGFRAARVRFESFLPPGAASSSPAYVGASDNSIDTRNGGVKSTGRPLDIRADDDAWIAVTVPVLHAGVEEEQVAYTRDGRLSLDADGTLLAAGHPVRSTSGGSIRTSPGDDVTIDDRGQVLQSGTVVDQIAFARFDEGGGSRVGPSLVFPDHPSAVVAVEPKVHTGEIEGSNASALDATVSLVTAQRAYDHAMQAIQTSRRLDERVADVARVRT